MKNYNDFKAIKNTYAHIIKVTTKDNIYSVLDAWQQDDKAIKEIYKSRFLTPKERETLTDAQQRQKIIEKMRKDATKQIDKLYHFADHIAQVEPTDYISIDVHYSKQGHPTARVETSNLVTYGKAFGGGYDRLSSAIADALNDNEQTLKIVFNLCEQVLRKSAQVWEIPRTIGFAVDTFSKYPRFQRGIGYGCIRELLQRGGAKINTWNDWKNGDTMYIGF